MTDDISREDLRRALSVSTRKRPTTTPSMLPGCATVALSSKKTSSAMIDLNCSSCVWSDEIEPWADQPHYCPECGGDVSVETDPSGLDPAETLSDTI